MTKNIKNLGSMESIIYFMTFLIILSITWGSFQTAVMIVCLGGFSSVLVNGTDPKYLLTKSSIITDIVGVVVLYPIFVIINWIFS